MPKLPRWQRVLADFPLYALSLGMLTLLVQTAWSRLGYPYDLEWMEGGMLNHAHRVLEGEPLYVMPELDFIPFIYPPLYPWILGMLGHVFELSHGLGRALSFAGTIAAGAAIVAAVRGERGGWAPAIGGAALFFACYPDSGSFMDLVRNDGLVMGLVAWALVLARWEQVRWAGLLLVLAFATKHAVAIYGLPALIWLWRCSGRATALKYMAWSVGPALLFTVVMTVTSDGLFLTYILGVPAAHPFVLKRFTQTAPLELMRALPWTSGLAVLALGLFWRRLGQGGLYWLAQAALGILLSMVMRGHHGGYLNVLMPGTWFLALGGALAVTRLRYRFTGLPVRAGTALLIAGQLWTARWAVERYAPTTADRVAGDGIVERLAAVDGPVLAPWSAYLPRQAGKEGSIALIALWDIHHKRSPLTQEARLIKHAIKAQHFGAVLTARTKSKKGLEGLGTSYSRASFAQAPRGSCGIPSPRAKDGKCKPTFELIGKRCSPSLTEYDWAKHWSKRVFCPRTGHPVKPQQLWVVKAD
jgi:hypothetical protein